MTKKNTLHKYSFAFYFSLLALVSCSTQKQLSKQAHNEILDKKEVSGAQVGICIFDPSTRKYLYNYQGDKYFIPASNTKLFSLYAGLKYLGDSIVAARFTIDNGTIILQATGDPTFLHPDFKNQPLLDFLKRKEIQVIRLNTSFASESFGAGWTWNDYQSEYMAERDPFPMYGNLATVIFGGDSIRTIPPSLQPFVIGKPEKGRRWDVTRELAAHSFTIDTGRGTTAPVKTITMAMNKGLFATRYLADTLHKVVLTEYDGLEPGEGIPIYSQPRDSLFKMMMHRSDNFFAEQTLLMAANEHLGQMSDARMIDTLLKKDFAELPQKPRWTDGSGLSRYNLFTPQDLVWLLDKLKNEFTLERLKVILPGANEGTLENLYKGYEGRIYAKTGTLSNHIALSGYILTKKNKQLLFSVMVGNHQSSASLIRREVEKFLTGIIDKY
jgi:D-alanyl-D-alanine carboxypeptidase/D-alanyl-D-alanine-endopeptidase (penicillin-binding protein 4)